MRSGVPDAWTVYDALGNRVATKINDVWQYVVYDAFGKCVAEYGQLADGLGGVKYVQQDWQGSVRTVTNGNGFVVSRTDHQAFGGEVGYGVGKRSIEQGYNVDKATRQGYGLTERDEASGLDHTWFRKNENAAGRWTSPDPYKGSMSLADPQSFNRYSYVQSQPTNFTDPTGLCVFKIVLTIATDASGQQGNVGVYGSQAVMDAAKAEISRIFNQAGHSVTFDPGAEADATYTSSITTGRSGNALGHTFGRYGGPSGEIFPQMLLHLGLRTIYGGGGIDGFSTAGMGLAPGRVVAHETVTHGFLGLSNAMHHGTGLTRPAFGSELFRGSAANAFRILATQAAELRKFCEPQRPPDNYAGGGGGGYVNGWGYSGGRYPSWWYATQEFLNWLYSIEVGGDDDSEDPRLG